MYARYYFSFSKGKSYVNVVKKDSKIQKLQKKKPNGLILVLKDCCHSPPLRQQRSSIVPTKLKQTCNIHKKTINQFSLLGFSSIMTSVPPLNGQKEQQEHVYVSPAFVDSSGLQQESQEQQQQERRIHRIVNAPMQSVNIVRNKSNDCSTHSAWLGGIALVLAGIIIFSFKK